jgi:hypothetical protein
MGNGKFDFLQEIKPNMGKSKNVYRFEADMAPESQKFYAEFWNTEHIKKGDFTRNGIFDTNKYYGDTIISFSTIAGCVIRLMFNMYPIPTKAEERLKCIIQYKKSDIISEETKALFKKFHESYHTLANFIPSPTKQIYDNENKTEINLNTFRNQFKGKFILHDFPDEFFILIKAYYDDNLSYSEKHPDIFKENQSYFEMFGSWKNYVEGNYLQDFFYDGEESNSNYEKFIKLSPFKSLELPYRKEEVPFSNTKEAVKYVPKFSEYVREFLEYTDNFLETSIKIIEARAERLSNVKI